MRYFLRGEFGLRAARRRWSRSAKGIPAKIGVERLGKAHPAVLPQSGFQQRNVQTCQRRAGTVQRMAKAILSVRAFEAQIHPPGLEIGKVRTARNFQEGLLPRRPYFEIVGFRGAETKVARAKL